MTTTSWAQQIRIAASLAGGLLVLACGDDASRSEHSVGETVQESGGTSGTGSTLTSSPNGGASAQDSQSSSTGGTSAAGGAVDTGGESGAGGTSAAGGAVDTGGESGAGGASEAATGEIGQSCQGETVTCQSCTFEGVCGTAESCCMNLTVPSGTFMMGRSTDSSVDDYYEYGNSSELPAHVVGIAAFILDKYEVTVSRFRAFVNAYDNWHTDADTNLAEDVGAHPDIPGSGWVTAWTSLLPDSASALASALATCTPAVNRTWTDTAEDNELYPISCVNWYEAMAFCIWDGGYLPSEAEWEYAAAGGEEERLYPWGSATPDATFANYDDGSASGNAKVTVGSRTAGHGRWLHEDLAGSRWEWTLDGYLRNWYEDANATGTNVCNLTDTTTRVTRGGAWEWEGQSIRSANRLYGDPEARDNFTGFRCARNP